MTIGTVLLVGHHFYGFFTPYNYFSAKGDINNGTIQVVIYGELRPNEELESEIASKYGFDYYLLGCEITQPLINGIDNYNNVVYDYLDDINGKDWQDKFQQERKENNLDW